MQLRTIRLAVVDPSHSWRLGRSYSIELGTPGYYTRGGSKSRDIAAAAEYTYPRFRSSGRAADT